MVFRRQIFLWVMMTVAISSTAFAQQNEVRSWYRGTRMMGMGGAGIAVVDDETALLVNPAGLGRLRDIYGTIIDPEFEGSTNWPSLYNTKAFTNPIDPESIGPTLGAMPNVPFHSKVAVFPSFVVKNFGIGLYGKYLLDAQTDASGANMQTFYQNDLALVMGFNFRLWGGRIKLGVTGKAIDRIEVNKNIPLSGTLGVAANGSEGLGIGYDAGLILTAPWAWLPSIAVVGRDIGNMTFTTSPSPRISSTTLPATVTQDYDVGISLSPIHSKRSRSVFTAEYQKVLASQNAIDKTRYYHIGYEYNFADLIYFRLGMNGRYWTSGLEFASEHTQIQFAYFADDIGPDNAPIEDRRWMWKFVFRF